MVLLSAYRDHGWIRFDYGSREWQWSLTSVRLDAIGALDSVVSLLEAQVSQLPSEQQELMLTAACLGNRFNLSTLAICLDCDEHTIARRIWPLLQLGFLVPLGNAAEVFALATSSPSATPAATLTNSSSSSSSSSETESETETETADATRDDAHRESNEETTICSSDGHPSSATPASTAAAMSHSSASASSERRPPSRIALRFLHDAVQQASYQLVDARARLECHLRIARALFAAMKAKTMTLLAASSSFHHAPALQIKLSDKYNPVDVADQFNIARSLLDVPDEMIAVIQLNQLAAAKARISTAYDRCHHHTSMANELLHTLSRIERRSIWERRYRLAFSVKRDLAMSFFLNNRFDEAEVVALELVERVIQAKSDYKQRREKKNEKEKEKEDEKQNEDEGNEKLEHDDDDDDESEGRLLQDHIESQALLSQVYSATPSSVTKCVECTMVTLRLLDFELLSPSSPEWHTVATKDPFEYVHAPEATDAHHLQTMKTAASILSTLVVTGEHQQLREIVYSMLHQAGRYGSSIYVACALVFLVRTFIESEAPDDISRCVTIGSACMRVFERFKSSPSTTGSMKARISTPFYGICSPWGEHWSVVGPAMWRIGVEAVQDGEYEYSGYCVWHTAGMRYYAGEPLKRLDRGCIEMINIARRIGRANQITFAVHTHQMVQKLIKAKRLDEPFLIDGERHTDDEVIRSLIDDKCFLFAHFMLTYQIQYRYYVRDYEGACQVVPQLEATRGASAGHVCQ